MNMVFIQLSRVHCCVYVTGGGSENFLQEIPDPIAHDRSATVFCFKDHMYLQPIEGIDPCCENAHFCLFIEVKVQCIKIMKSRKAHCVQIYPTTEEATSQKIFSRCHIAHNRAPRKLRTFWSTCRAQTRKYIFRMGRKRELPTLAETLLCLEDARTYCLNMTLTDLNRARQRIFGDLSVNPKPRKKLLNHSFFSPEAEQIEIVYRAGLLLVRNSSKAKRYSRPCQAVLCHSVRRQVKRVTISPESRNWHCALSSSIDVRANQSSMSLSADNVVGVNFGVTDPVTTLTEKFLGLKIPSANDRKKQLRLRTNLGQTQHGSSRPKKAQSRFPSPQAKITLYCRGSCHKVTCHLADLHRVSVFVKLSVQVFTQCARVPMTLFDHDPGQKSKLNRYILKMGSEHAKRQLDHNLEWSVRCLNEVPVRNIFRIRGRSQIIDVALRQEKDIFSCEARVFTGPNVFNFSNEIRHPGLEALGSGFWPELSGQTFEHCDLDKAMKRGNNQGVLQPDVRPSSCMLVA
jgi:hypothetical protein